MRRRDFIALVASTALASPHASAQQCSGLPLVAMLSPVSAAAAQPNLEAFRQGLARLGLEEGQQFMLITRFGGGDPDVIKTAARELVALKPDVIVAGPPPSECVERPSLRRPKTCTKGDSCSAQKAAKKWTRQYPVVHLDQCTKPLPQKSRLRALAV